MNRRIRSIFWLMTFCIIGINAFQGYWLWATYQFNRQQFSRTVQDALFSVFRQHQITEDKSYPGPPGMGAAPDRPPRRIPHHIVLDKAEGTRIGLAQLSFAYWSELNQRGINARFLLDTVRINTQTPSKTIPVNPLEARLTRNDASNVVTTLLLPINSAGDLFARATVETPTFYLIRRMGWLLGSSVFLLMLTTGCFLVMLSTILRQRKLSEVKNEFINNMTHELKTPIATVTAAVEALQHFGALNDPQKTQTYLAISHTNLQRLSDLVEKVLNLAVEEKKELSLNPEWVKPSELINQATGNYQLNVDKPVEFQVAVETADEPVLIDRFHMVNALTNLIDNAIKYSGESVTIQIASQQREHVWRLSVKDNGMGIAKAYQAAIFDRFFRVPTGNRHPVKGFGLGLSYVRQVVEKHGGLAEVASEPGQGSEFTLLVPMHGGTGQVGIKRFRVNLNPLQSTF